MAFAYDPEMAKLLGSADDASVFNSLVHHLKFSQAKREHRLGGRTWCFMSVAQLHEVYPWIHERTLRRMLDALVGTHGLLRRATPHERAVLQRQNGKSPWVQVNWFCLVDEVRFLGCETGPPEEAKSGLLEETAGNLSSSKRPEVASSERTPVDASTRTPVDASPRLLLPMHADMQQHTAGAASHTPSDRLRNHCALPRAAGPGEQATHEPHANGCALPRAAAEMHTQGTPDGIFADALPVAVPPPSPALPSQAVEAFDAGADLLHRQGIASAKAAALAQGHTAEEIREWIRVAKGKRHSAGFLVAMLSADEPLPAEAQQRLRERERAMTRACHAQEEERAQAHEPVPDLAVLFPEYAHRVRRWVDYRSAGAGVTVPATSPAPAAEWERNPAVSARHTRELCHTMTDCQSR